MCPLFSSVNCVPSCFESSGALPVWHLRFSAPISRKYVRSAEGCSDSQYNSKAGRSIGVGWAEISRSLLDFLAIFEEVQEDGQCNTIRHHRLGLPQPIFQFPTLAACVLTPCRAHPISITLTVLHDRRFQGTYING
ncbi:hypothetical protein K443DRAFT_432404 [Laccaria amethystina LaAM-08-1]|uniref:Uncharacterized protein n=1 Tax=Laccaria amethystina LaAM-08-1 TaxID=1095629 RepID=A0A0C9WWW3_9AGAR|nr:hypothetical protein K443DRAFT_432404 [Laccaria amethystina LaAM-08-1]